MMFLLVDSSFIFRNSRCPDAVIGAALWWMVLVRAESHNLTVSYHAIIPIVKDCIIILLSTCRKRFFWKTLTNKSRMCYPRVDNDHQAIARNGGLFSFGHQRQKAPGRASRSRQGGGGGGGGGGKERGSRENRSKEKGLKEKGSRETKRSAERK